MHAEHVGSPALFDEIFLKRDFSVCRPDPGFDAFVRHWKNCRAYVQRAPDLIGYLRKFSALTEQTGADDVGREISIAEIKPDLLAEPAKLLQHDEGIIFNAPTFVAVAQSCKGIRDRIDIGSHVEPVEDTVISGIANDRKLRRIGHRGQPLDELGATGAAGEHDDHLEASALTAVVGGRSIGRSRSGPLSFASPSGPQRRLT